MKRVRNLLLVAGLVVIALILGLVLGERGGLSGLLERLRSARAYKHDPNDPALKAALPPRDPAAGLPPSPLNDLLKPNLTPQEQTSIVGQMLIDYWTTTHTLPNGTWEETVAQLAGANRQKLALMPKDHPAIGKDGFRSSPASPGIHIHVISSSGCAFQLIYDGPDGKPYTDDDLVRSFPPDLEFR